MSPWKIFVIGSLLLTLVLIGGFLLVRHRHPLEIEGQEASQGARLLVLSLWVASLSMIAYVAFVFGKR